MVKLTGLKKVKTAVFISGTGSNLKNLIKFSKIKNSPISIDLIFSNTSKAIGLKFSNQFKIKKYVSSFTNSKVAEVKILNLLKKENIEFICLAGFMKILSKSFIKNFNGKIINIHPSSPEGPLCGPHDGPPLFFRKCFHLLATLCYDAHWPFTWLPPPPLSLAPV